LTRATLSAGALDDARRHLVWLLALQAMARGEAVAARNELRPARQESPEVLLPVLARMLGFEPQLVRLALAAGDRPLADRAVGEAAQRARLTPDNPAIAAAAMYARASRCATTVSTIYRPPSIT
jgi:hypothetical protein